MSVLMKILEEPWSRATRLVEEQSLAPIGMKSSKKIMKVKIDLMHLKVNNGQETIE